MLAEQFAKIDQIVPPSTTQTNNTKHQQLFVQYSFVRDPENVQTNMSETAPPPGQSCQCNRNDHGSLHFWNLLKIPIISINPMTIC